MMQLAKISDLPLGEFSRAISRDEIPVGDLRSAIELFTHKIAVDQYGKDVVEHNAPVWEAMIVRARDEGDMSPVESVERTAHLALVLLGKFGVDDEVLFLSPRRVAARSLQALPLTIGEVSAMVPVTNLAELGFENLRNLRDVKRIMSPTVKVCVSWGTHTDEVDGWSALLPVIP